MMALYCMKGLSSLPNNTILIKEQKAAHNMHVYRLPMMRILHTCTAQGTEKKKKEKKHRSELDPPILSNANIWLLDHSVGRLSAHLLVELQ